MSAHQDQENQRARYPYLEHEIEHDIIHKPMLIKQ